MYYSGQSGSVRSCGRKGEEAWVGAAEGKSWKPWEDRDTRRSPSPWWGQVVMLPPVSSQGALGKNVCQKLGLEVCLWWRG